MDMDDLRSDGVGWVSAGNVAFSGFFSVLDRGGSPDFSVDGAFGSTEVKYSLISS
jgi:hypothetical protein